MALPVSIPTRRRCVGYVESGKQADRNDVFRYNNNPVAYVF